MTNTMKASDFINYATDHELSIRDMAKMIGVAPMTYIKFIKSGKRPTKQHNSVTQSLTNFYNKHIKKDETSQIIEAPKQIIKRSAKTELVYLESVEDVINELRAGNEIIASGSSNKTLKMVDGFIISYSNNMATAINPAILCSEKYCVIKEIPLKLEVGKRYYTADGCIATIFNEFSDGDIYCGVFSGERFIFEFDPHGKTLNAEQDTDLVEEVA